MQPRIETTGRELIERLRAFGERPVSTWRRDMILSVTREVLRRTLHRQPVRSGRARESWRQALEELERASAGHDGGTGIGVASPDISVRDADNADETAIDVVNQVEYVPFLEYGTRRGAPREMVGQSLAEVAPLVPDLAPPLLE